MDKKLVIFSVVAILILEGLFAYNNYKEKNRMVSDALKFKEEYESLNDEINDKNGKNFRFISISENNPFIYKEAEDIVEMIKRNETFVVYFGFNSCPWCRSVVPTLINVAKDLNIKKVYYVDIKDIRDKIIINDDGKLEVTKEGSEAYYKLLELMEHVLNDYNLTDSNGKTVFANEKRIYAPNVVAVINGVAERLDSGISEKQTDSSMALTDEIIKDTYHKFECILKCLKESQYVCNEGC